jgi:hypothetical protein
VTVAIGLCLQFTTTVFAQDDKSATLKDCSVTFFTTSENKDKDTQVEARIIVNKHDVASLKGWDNMDWPTSFDPNYWWNLNVIERPTKESLNLGAFHVTATANGNDHWKFTAKLKATFSDDTKREWTFEGGDLNSRGSTPVAQEWEMAKCLKP